MFFGIREKDYSLGSFSSDKCTACKESNTYTFRKAVRFFVAVFINLIPLSSRYECECEECGEVTELDQAAGKEIAKTRFSSKNSNVTIAAVLRIAAFCVVIAAAIVVPLMLTAQPATDPDSLKALVDGDGTYSIQNRDGDTLAIVIEEDGEKTLPYYAEISQLTGESGADGMVMTLAYEESETGEDGETVFEPNTSDTGVLTDQYNTPVRSYHYDLANEAFGYSLGVEDLSSIEYSENKAVYPFTYYTSDTEQVSYTVVLHIADNQYISATFEPSSQDETEMQISEIVISDFENGRQTQETLYLISSDTDEIVFVGAISEDSSADEILSFIEENELVSSYSESYTYYKNTDVLTAVTASVTDSSGSVQTVTQEYNVEERGGLYIVTEKTDDDTSSDDSESDDTASDDTSSDDSESDDTASDDTSSDDSESDDSASDDTSSDDTSSDDTSSDDSESDDTASDDTSSDDSESDDTASDDTSSDNSESDDSASE